MFLVNSRHRLCAATQVSFGRLVLHLPGHPFSRSYGANLPSSLRRVPPSALEYLLPTHLCRFAVRSHRLHRLGAISRQSGIARFAALSGGSPSGLGLIGGKDLPRPQPTPLDRAFHHPARAILLRHPFAPPVWRGNINPLPITYAFRPRLRVPANPPLIYIEAETLGFRRGGFSPPFAATHARIFTSRQSTVSYETTSTRLERSPTDWP